jgi:hypothetical protein
MEAETRAAEGHTRVSRLNKLHILHYSCALIFKFGGVFNDANGFKRQ